MTSAANRPFAGKQEGRGGDGEDRQQRHGDRQADLIGHGTHQRVVVSNQKFLDKAYSKL